MSDSLYSVSVRSNAGTTIVPSSVSEFDFARSQHQHGHASSKELRRGIRKQLVEDWRQLWKPMGDGSGVNVNLQSPLLGTNLFAGTKPPTRDEVEDVVGASSAASTVMNSSMFAPSSLVAYMPLTLRKPASAQPKRLETVPEETKPLGPLLDLPILTEPVGKTASVGKKEIEYDDDYWGLPIPASALKPRYSLPHRQAAPRPPKKVLAEVEAEEEVEEDLLSFKPGNSRIRFQTPASHHGHKGTVEENEKSGVESEHPFDTEVPIHGIASLDPVKDFFL